MMKKCSSVAWTKNTSHLLFHPILSRICSILVECHMIGGFLFSSVLFFLPYLLFKERERTQSWRDCGRHGKSCGSRKNYDKVYCLKFSTNIYICFSKTPEDLFLLTEISIKTHRNQGEQQMRVDPLVKKHVKYKSQLMESNLLLNMQY